MKKSLIALISIACISSMLFVGCRVDSDNPSTTTQDPVGGTRAPQTEITTDVPDATTVPTQLTTATQTTPSTPTEDESGPFTVTESYLPAKTAAKIRTMFEQKRVTVLPYAKQETAPYALADLKGISDGKLVSITIPVVKTDAKDANGDFLFTISVIGNDDAGIKGSVKRSYGIKINAEKYGLTDNNISVYRFIKVDLTEYDIVLTSSETLAFFGMNDTVYPAYLTSANALAVILSEEFPRATGYYNFGTSNAANGVKISANSLLYDFEFERTYETKAERDMAINYEGVVATLKQAYGGKYFSILGDSISTFDGFCNNTSVNASLAENVKLYPWGEVNDFSKTYWGRLIGDTGMTLCVNNAWSGSHVIGTSKWSYKDNMYYRATELDRDSGEAPEVIFVFMSTNDLIHTSSFGDLYNILTANDGRTEKEKIEAWFDSVSSAAKSSGDKVKPFSTWDAGYALALRAMKDKYGDAEIFCMTLMPNHHSGYTAQKLLQYNTCIKALGNYFGATVIELDGGDITYDNCNGYTVDGSGDAIHPNIKGYAYIEKCIIKAMYNKIINK